MHYLLFIVSIVMLYSCSTKKLNIRKIYSENEIGNIVLDKQSIKIHLKNHKLIILNDYNVDNTKEVITGTGTLYSVNRKQISDTDNHFTISFKECTLIETNEYKGFNLFSPMIMVFPTVMSLYTIPCLFDPKSCFGSCPTFYLYENDKPVLQAEGFSSSITRSMESSDIDALYGYDSNLTEIKIDVRNEAFETHYIRNVELYAVPKPSKGLVFYGNGKFYITSEIIHPKNLVSGNPKCFDLIRERDNKEYYSKSDSTNLLSKESIILEFEENDALSTGIIITKRQSLLTTYLFYQSMAYMGAKAGEFIALYENSSALIRNSVKSINELLGGIEVRVLIDGKWKKVGVINEQGPIASDVHILPIDYKGEFNKVKLTLTKGLWRIDQIGLCKIIGEQKPIKVKPKLLLNNGVLDSVLHSILVDDENMLVNFPGTCYTLIFDVPPMNNFSLFLYSRGYYVEWMRNEWLKEENPKMVNMILKHPQKWLKVMAPLYKGIENQMESLFWTSKYTNNEY
jgi:hypothetical protein